MTQQQAITSFLDSGVSTPAANQAANQSGRTKRTRRTNKGARETGQSPCDPPQRTHMKRKRITKEEKKRERKRINRPRKCKASLIDRSLTDMLASGGLSAQPTPSASGSGDVINSSERVARLEAQITAAALALEHELSEKRSLSNAMDLLQN